jgi:hypothetical protein
MDLGIIIAIVGSAIAIVGVMVALFLWNRGESNSDRRELSSIINSDRREMMTILEAIKEDGKIFREKWAEENKEYHARLCMIEERQQANKDK